MFDLSVLILKSIYAPVVKFHEGPYKGLFGFLSYGVYVFLKVLVGRDIRPRIVFMYAIRP